MEIFFLLIVTLFIIPEGAHAYLDPGTGSYVIQVVIASLAAGTYFFKDKIGGAISSIKDKLMKDKNGKKK